MKILIPGGTGQIGTVLTRGLTGHEVIPIGRHTTPNWQDLPALIDGSDVIINLAGRSVNCRYNQPNRHAIIDSRTSTTRVIGQAIQASNHPPRLWLQMSTATIYAHRYDAPNDEKTGILGTTRDDVPDTWNFSHDVALEWEQSATEIETPQTRKVLLRTAIVMNPDPGSAFDMLFTLVRTRLGGASGDGRQFVSWIHQRDFARAITFLIEHQEIDGPVNLASPNPLPNQQFMAALRQAAGVSFGLSATNWMLEIGAFFLRTETELILKSRRVIPGRLLDSGFTFDFPHWPEAARDLCPRRLSNIVHNPKK